MRSAGCRYLTKLRLEFEGNELCELLNITRKCVNYSQYFALVLNILIYNAAKYREYSYM